MTSLSPEVSLLGETVWAETRCSARNERHSAHVARDKIGLAIPNNAQMRPGESQSWSEEHRMRYMLSIHLNDRYESEVELSDWVIRTLIPDVVVRPGSPEWMTMQKRRSSRLGSFRVRGARPRRRLWAPWRSRLRHSAPDTNLLGPKSAIDLLLHWLLGHPALTE